jgi:prophage maintenance system killer protein
MIRESVSYLTVQDVLWINLQITGKVNHFNFAKLEEATYYQYAYGESTNILSQVARFVPGFMKMKPFDRANAATAFVSALTFLELNHYNVSVTDDHALDWFSELASKISVHDALRKVSESKGDHHDIGGIKEVAESVMSRFHHTIIRLSD